MADDEPGPDTGATGTEGVPETVVEAAETPQSSSEPAHIEQFARKHRWAPKEEWHGAEEDWVDAETYVDRMLDVGQSYRKKLRNLEKSVERIGETTSRMTDLALKKQLDDLHAKREEAFETGDKAAFQKADNEIKELSEVVAKPTVVPPTEEGRSFAEKHSSWFNVDMEATQWAVERSAELGAKGLSPSRQMQALEREAKELFPEHFPEGKTVKKPPTLAAPQRSVSTAPREKGYATLSPIERKTCDEWVKRQRENGRTWATKELWAANFYEEATNG